MSGTETETHTSGSHGDPSASEVETVSDHDTVDAWKACQGLNLCSTLLGCENIQNNSLILSMEGSTTSLKHQQHVARMSMSSGAEMDSICDTTMDDLSISTVRIDARCNRGDLKVTLAKIMKHLDMPDQETASESSSRTSLSQLMENMIGSEDSD